MKYIEHIIEDGILIEVQTNDIIINSEQDILDLIINIEYQFNTKKIILQRNNVHDDFYELKTGLAGSILQKLANYKVKMAIVGNFDDIKSKSFQDFVYESNKNKQVVFVKNTSVALTNMN